MATVFFLITKDVVYDSVNNQLLSKASRDSLANDYGYTDEYDQICDEGYVFEGDDQSCNGNVSSMSGYTILYVDFC